MTDVSLLGGIEELSRMYHAGFESGARLRNVVAPFVKYARENQPDRRKQEAALHGEFMSAKMVAYREGFMSAWWEKTT